MGMARAINDPAASCGVLGYQRTQQAAGNGPMEIQNSQLSVTVIASAEVVIAEVIDSRPDTVSLSGDPKEAQREQLVLDAWSIAARAGAPGGAPTTSLPSGTCAPPIPPPWAGATGWSWRGSSGSCAVAPAWRWQKARHPGKKFSPPARSAGQWATWPRCRRRSPTTSHAPPPNCAPRAVRPRPCRWCCARGGPAPRLCRGRGATARPAPGGAQPGGLAHARRRRPHGGARGGVGSHQRPLGPGHPAPGPRGVRPALGHAPGPALPGLHGPLGRPAGGAGGING